MLSLCHPVAGDKTYLSKNKYLKSFDQFERMMLHAESLSFEHPETGESVTINSELPKEFKQIKT